MSSAPASEENLITCSTCGKKLRTTGIRLDSLAKCPHCRDLFVMAPDNDPRRLVEVWFSKKNRFTESTINRIKYYIEGSQQSLDVAMFSLTHDWLKISFEKAVNKGVKIRILLDKGQAQTDSGEIKRGADYEYYHQLGIDIALDVKPGLMHHKFAVRDRKAVLTGSYNWSKAAHETNQENFLILWHSHVVSAFAEEFERLWQENQPGILLDPLG